MSDAPRKRVAPTAKKTSWFRAYARGQETGTLKGLLQSLRLWAQPHEKGQVLKRQHRVNTKEGPMAFLGDQIVKRMEKAGYPSRIFCCYRSPEEQERVYQKGNSKARAFHSPHQYLEAVDIIHKTRAWDVSQDYWDTLASVVRIVAREYGVEFEHGYDWGWDSAHVELKSWRDVRDAQTRPWHVPTSDDLDARFAEVLPAIYANLTRNRS